LKTNENKLKIKKYTKNRSDTPVGLTKYQDPS